ncbi:MAG: hypothetical protein ACOVOQ_00165 [Flavobacterium sp.]
MKHIKLYEEFLNEGKFQDLQNFLDELISLVQKNKKDFSLEKNSGIQLDVVGGFGFNQETVVIELEALAKELGTSEKFVEEMVLDTFSKYKSFLRKGITRSGGLFVTYKK